MHALRLNGWKSEAVLEDVPVPEPGPGQVLVQVGGAGACHSDLHLMHDFEDGLLPWHLPFTLGHENAGWVHTLGTGVTGPEPGQPVAVVGAWGCGACARCRVGFETYCEDPANAPVPAGGGGLGLDGGMAEYLLVPAARFLVPLPDGLDPVHAAPLTDAGLTPYHAIKRSLPKLTPDATAVVIGVGGLGHLAVQLLKAVCAAQVIAVDPRAEARQLADEAGADLSLSPDADTAATIRQAAHGRGADVVLDFVGSEATMQTGLAATRMLGDFTLVGIAGGSVPFSFFSQAYEVSLQTTYWGTRGELVEVLDLAARGLLRPDITRFSLADAPEAYRRLAAGEVAGRAVVVPRDAYRA
ncbi:oxidoreductase [Nocardioides szechwanensis]|uniref:alcohol dehydrogenase n=1 Tax=Nocardioides szechwanensis TaxID=1005944 RepID=A0A1H0EG36_9ACTN|nr:NAD(P)-dependent alcohol dehydrogenase [Nocardioides szechwanensis]GEP34682.1 oxidoreductase [Nocardioides szechwanensis]SDN81385.1 alcohol dehydrogenase, propanol-preferring [Nocardioides szechwanensis]